MTSIPICKDDEVQVDCYLLLRSCATNTTYAPSPSARTTRCRSIATSSFELRHKYNVRSILVRKDDKAQFAPSREQIPKAMTSIFKSSLDKS